MGQAGTFSAMEGDADLQTAKLCLQVQWALCRTLREGERDSLRPFSQQGL